jgi:UDP-glucose 4-epimerase
MSYEIAKKYPIYIGLIFILEKDMMELLNFLHSKCSNYSSILFLRYDKNEIVITGGLGFIGRNLVNFLDRKLKNYRFIVYDKSKKNLKLLNLKSSKNKIDIIIANTLDIEKKLYKYKRINTIFHLGEFSRIVKSFEHTDECFTSNTLGTYKVLNFCKKIK